MIDEKEKITEKLDSINNIEIKRIDEDDKVNN